jgi:group I intron endonuclease
MIGIYKITSPSGKIYIGQSVDIKTRFRKYKYLNCKRQVYLYNSFQKYGVNNHKFDIIEECLLEQLNEREIYWGTYYKVLENGLNLRLGDANGLCSEETKIKIGKGNLGKVLSEETKNNISKALKGRKVTWNTPGPKGYKYTEEQKQKMRKPKINKWTRETLLTPTQVTEIRTKHSQGQRICDLNKEYNVSWGTIKNVVEKLGGYK